MILVIIPSWFENAELGRFNGSNIQSCLSVYLPNIKKSYDINVSFYSFVNMSFSKTCCDIIRNKYDLVSLVIGTVDSTC